MEFEKILSQHRVVIKEYRTEEIKVNLKDWLRETSEIGCDDDVTVALVYLNNA